MAVTLTTVLDELGTRIVNDIRGQLMKGDKPKYASGTLVDNLTFEVIGKQLIIKSQGAGKYQRIVDSGRRPGKYPARGVIEDWIKIKNLQPRDKNVRQKDLAFVIKRKIQQEGIPGINFTKNTLNKFSSIIAQSVGVEYQKELQRIMKELKTIT
tara:strand:- start:308 stop:769 length:462 start_codon:yes stop_codon:yes gene_type:complete